MRACTPTLGHARCCCCCADMSKSARLDEFDVNQYEATKSQTKLVNRKQMYWQPEHHLRERSVGIVEYSRNPVSATQTAKVVAVGSSGVGKTTFITAVAQNKPNKVLRSATQLSEVFATLGVDFCVVTRSVNEHILRLQLWDTAGQEKFSHLIPAYLRGAAVILVFYDISDEKSFEDVERMWLPFINGVAGRVQQLSTGGNDSEDECIDPYDDELILPFVALVGCKSDLNDRRKVTRERARKFAQQHSIDAQFECTALDHKSVHHIVDTITTALYNHWCYCKAAGKQVQSLENTTNVKEKKSLSSCCSH